MKRLGVLALLLVFSAARADDRPEFRALWVDAVTSASVGIKTPDQIDQLIADAKELRCNALVAQVRPRGNSLYRKSLEPFSEDKTVPEGFDPLDYLLEKAHAQGLQVHAWVNVGTVWPAKGAPPKDPNHILNKHGPDAADTWLTRDDQGNTKFASGYFADPGHPGYAEHFVRVVTHMARNYAVDGVHLDFVRYHETEGNLNDGYGAGYNPVNVARFQKAYGLNQPPRRDDPNWKQWRREQVTSLVRQLRVSLMEVKPTVALSAALIPWGAGPAGEEEWFKSAPYNRVFQDWHAWRKEGLLDFIIPMNYDREVNPAQKEYFRQWVRFETEHKHKSLSIVGLGAYMNSPADTAAQVKVAQDAGADGVCFFSYASLRKNWDAYRDALVGAGGPFAAPAKWRTLPRLEKPAEGAIAGRAATDYQTMWLEPVGGGKAHRLQVNQQQFAAVGLKPGRYRLSADAGGYQVAQVEVVAGQVAQVSGSSGLANPPKVLPAKFSDTTAPAPVPAKGERKMTVEDLWKIKRLGAPSISPDGAWCVVEVTTWDMDKDEPLSELWLLATDGSSQRQLTNSGGRNSSPRFSPDGRSIAFIAKRPGDDVGQIYVIKPEGGEARRVSRMVAGPAALKWGADSQTIYSIGWTWPNASDAEHKAKEKQLKEAKSKAVIITDAAFRYWDKWIADGKRPSVFAIDVASGQHRDLLAGTGRHLPPYEPSGNDYDVSPDGKELCFVSENVKEIGLDSNHDLFALDITKPGGTPRVLTSDNAGHDTSPVYSPDGKSIAFLRQTTKFFYADRHRLMVMDREGGKPREFMAERPMDRSVAHPQWLSNSGSTPTLLGEVEDAGYIRLGLFGGGDPARLLPGRYSDRSADAAAKSGKVVFLRSSFSQPPQVFAGDINGPKRRIDRFNDDLTSQWKLGKVEEVQISGAGGREIQMWVIYPPDFDPAKKWPLVQVVHGGPHNAITTDFSFRWNPQLWAAQGWVIGIVNFHGSSGFGQEFTDSITGDLGTKPLEDILKGTDWFTEKPWIDANRLATAGASYGGYMMAWMNGHTDRFKAMVCHAGVYNWHSMLASDMVRGRERSLGAPPWGDLSKIDKQNAQRFAANFKTPTLVIHGEKDYRVPVGQGFEYYNTLRQKGVPTKLLYFPDENHWVLKGHNSLVWHREVFDWIGKYIGNGPG